MKNLKIAASFLILLLPLSATAQTAKIASLITAITKKYPQSSKVYTLIEIGSTGYLIKGNSPKILKTERISGAGGMCESYAVVRTVLSNLHMTEDSEGEASIWKYDGKNWNEVAHSAGGERQCRDVRSIPKRIRDCLDASDCY